jgi:hypothetical protein
MGREDFLKGALGRAAEAASRGDGEGCRRILDHAVAEDPSAIGRIAEAVRNGRN